MPLRARPLGTWGYCKAWAWPRIVHRASGLQAVGCYGLYCACRESRASTRSRARVSCSALTLTACILPKATFLRRPISINSGTDFSIIPDKSHFYSNLLIRYVDIARDTTSMKTRTGTRNMKNESSRNTEPGTVPHASWLLRAAPGISTLQSRRPARTTSVADLSRLT